MDFKQAMEQQLSLDDLQIQYTRYVLNNSASINDAAELLGVNSSTLWRLRKKHKIKLRKKKILTEKLVHISSTKLEVVGEERVNR